MVIMTYMLWDLPTTWALTKLSCVLWHVVIITSWRVQGQIHT